MSPQLSYALYSSRLWLNQPSYFLYPRDLVSQKLVFASTKRWRFSHLARTTALASHYRLPFTWSWLVRLVPAVVLAEAIIGAAKRPQRPRSNLDKAVVSRIYP